MGLTELKIKDIEVLLHMLLPIEKPHVVPSLLASLGACAVHTVEANIPSWNINGTYS